MDVFKWMMWFTFGSTAFVLLSAGLCYYLDKKYRHPKEKKED